MGGKSTTEMNALGIIPAIYSVIMVAIGVAAGWVAWFCLNAAPILGSMAVNYIAVILLVLFALGLITYGIAALAMSAAIMADTG
jgi:hypothetical protein